MTTQQFIDTVKLAQKLDRAIRKANAPNQVVESYLAAMQNELAGLQAYLEQTADEIRAQRNAADE